MGQSSLPHRVEEVNVPRKLVVRLRLSPHPARAGRAVRVSFVVAAGLEWAAALLTSAAVEVYPGRQLRRLTIYDVTIEEVENEPHGHILARRADGVLIRTRPATCDGSRGSARNLVFKKIARALNGASEKSSEEPGNP